MITVDDALVKAVRLVEGEREKIQDLRDPIREALWRARTEIMKLRWELKKEQEKHDAMVHI